MNRCRVDIPGKGLIRFEGVTLSEGAKHFEAASFFPSLPEDIRTWVLDLRYAWARERQAPSNLVLRACDEIEGRIYSEREALFAHLRSTFKQDDPAEICEEWLMVIQTIRGCAETRETCSWTMEPESGEIAYYLNQMIRMVGAMEKVQSRTAFPPGFADRIKTAPEHEQVAFIHLITDALSS